MMPTLPYHILIDKYRENPTPQGLRHIKLRQKQIEWEIERLRKEFEREHGDIL